MNVIKVGLLIVCPLSLALTGQLLAQERASPVSVSEAQDTAAEIPIATGNQDAEIGSEQSQAQGSRPIEEIQVIGERSQFRLRMDLIAVEDDLYGLFNELNSDDDFDINCERVKPTGSHISRRLCEAKLVTDLRAENVRNYLSGLDGLFTPAQLEAEVAKRMQELVTEFERLALENFKFREAMLKFNDLDTEYKQRRKENWGWLIGM